MIEIDNGEMIVIRQENEEEWTDSRGEKRASRNSEAYYAIRSPESYDISEGTPRVWSNSSYRIPGDVYIYTLRDIEAYRKLLDAIEERVIAREEAQQ